MICSSVLLFGRVDHPLPLYSLCSNLKSRCLGISIFSLNNVNIGLCYLYFLFIVASIHVMLEQLWGSQAVSTPLRLTRRQKWIPRRREAPRNDTIKSSWQICLLVDVILRSTQGWSPISSHSGMDLRSSFAAFIRHDRGRDACLCPSVATIDNLSSR